MYLCEKVTKMKANQLSNLILFSLILISDNNYDSSPDYIKENYYRFFNGRPDKMDVIEVFNKRNPDVNDIFTTLMKRWKITKDYKDFDIYYTSIMFTTIWNLNNIDDILNYYNVLYKSSDSLKNELKDSYAHENLRQKLILFQNKHSRYFKLLRLKEKIADKRCFELI